MSIANFIPEIFGAGILKERDSYKKLLEDIEHGVVKTGQDSAVNRRKVFSKTNELSPSYANIC